MRDRSLFDKLVYIVQGYEYAPTPAAYLICGEDIPVDPSADGIRMNRHQLGGAADGDIFRS